MQLADLLDVGFAIAVAVFFINRYIKSEEQRHADRAEQEEKLTELVQRVNSTTESSANALQAALNYIRGSKEK